MNIEISSDISDHDLLSLLTKEEHRESFMGGHFLSVYVECPWKFYFRYILGLMPIENQRFFIRGQAPLSPK